MVQHITSEYQNSRMTFALKFAQSFKDDENSEIDPATGLRIAKFTEADAKLLIALAENGLVQLKKPN